MAPILRKYNAAATIDGVVLKTAGAQNFQPNPTLAAGDVKISKDGGALANIAALPVVTPAGSRLVRVSLSAAELQAQRIAVLFVDQAGAEWEDKIIVIETYRHASAAHALDLDSDVATALLSALRDDHQVAGSIGQAIYRLHADAANKKIANADTGETKVYKDDGVTVSHKRTVQQGPTDDEVTLLPT
jgi:hypothetical protein